MNKKEKRQNEATHQLGAYAAVQAAMSIRDLYFKIEMLERKVARLEMINHVDISTGR